MQENGSDFTLSKPTEGVKLSGSLDAGKNCKWIVSLETPVLLQGPKVQATRKRLESLRQKDRGCYDLITS